MKALPAGDAASGEVAVVAAAPNDDDEGDGGKPDPVREEFHQFKNYYNNIKTYVNNYS